MPCRPSPAGAVSLRLHDPARIDFELFANAPNVALLQAQSNARPCDVTDAIFGLSIAFAIEPVRVTTAEPQNVLAVIDAARGVLQVTFDPALVARVRAAPDVAYRLWRADAGAETPLVTGVLTTRAVAIVPA